MDTSDSSEDHSTSDCTSDSSDDDEKLETAQVCGVRMQLPQGLCERTDLFKEFFSMHTWNSFTEENKQHLKNFLPTFPENEERERNLTLQMLFNGETFRFKNPMNEFHDHLKAGHYRPDIAKMRYMIKKAERKEAKYRHRRFRSSLKEDILANRRKLLNLVKNLPPGIEPKVEKFNTNTPSYVSAVAHRTKKRYFQELSVIRTKVEESGFSSDENYPEGPPAPLSRKQKRHLNSIKNSQVLNGEKAIISTFSTKANGFDLERSITPSSNPFFVTEDSYRELLVSHKKRKLECADDAEYNTKGISVADVIQRTQLPYIKKLNNTKHHLDYKVTQRKRFKKEPPVPQEINKLNPFFGHSSNSDFDSDSDLDTFNLQAKNKVRTVKKLVPQKPVMNKKPDNPDVKFSTNTAVSKTTNSKPAYTPASLSDLEGLDMMTLPIDFNESNIDILEINNKPELMQETHSNFLSLVRDIICSTNEHRMNMRTLEERLKSWQENPISPLNDWYSLTDNWVLILQSAVDFLSGSFPDMPDEFVPYIEFKPQLNMYQWIGAGRDSDGLLTPLCQYWMEHKNEIKSSSKDKDELDIELADKDQTPLPPRCPTTWTVRKSDADEIEEFRKQERLRYNNPHKSFTYRCHGYESVVGAVKGIYSNQSVGVSKARGHSMLNADRPNFVTILTLVRDATARLPNGEGTRAEICELLKCSQYISSNAPDNVLQSVVSGALDRMHTQFDPCVKYDPKRKVWIYLHRHRTEEDFDRLHQQYQGMAKMAKKPCKNKLPKNKVKVEKVKVKGEGVLNVVEKAKLPSKPVITMKSTILGKDLKILPPKLNPAKVITNRTASVSSPEIGEVHFKTTQLTQTIKKIRQTPPLEEKDIEVLSKPISTVPLSALKSGKSLVKILTPNQGKSLIIPSTSMLKQDVNKQVHQSQLVAQQLLQTIATQQKQQSAQAAQKIGDGNKLIEKIQLQTKMPAAIQQQLLQSLTPQQLQNIKNIALLRNVAQTQGVTQLTQSNAIIQSQINKIDDGPQFSTVKHTIVQEVKRPQPSFTPAQQQQILQTLKQKVLPLQSTALSSSQVILKPKTGLAQIQKQQVATTSLLGQVKVNSTDRTTENVITTTQTPLVAKVFTNATGQVISVESLMAHQKQHGSLPQGTTLRISGTKTGHANVIQLAASPSQNSRTQFTLSSTNNIVTIANQPKLVVSTPTTTTITSTITKPISKPVTKTQTITKFLPRVTQQLVNAKFLQQTLAGQKIVQPKVVMGQQNQIKIPITGKNIAISKPVHLNMTANANTIRMVNAANLNLTQIGGKPVLLASKTSSVPNLQGQNVIIQTQANSSGGPSLIITNAGKTIQGNLSQGGTGNAQVILGPQLKVQQSPQQVMLSSAIKTTLQSQPSSQGQIMLGGQPVRLQTTSAGGTQRVVLTSQGQGGQIVAQQILLPAGFQGAAINIKALQGVKVVPITQTQQSRGGVLGIQGRQVFARVMNSSNVVRVTSANVNDDAAAPTSE